MYFTDDDEQMYKTAGMPQGLILRPPWWNIMYDGVIRLAVMDGARIIGFADDLAGTVVRKTLDKVKVLVNVMIQSIRCYLKSMDLKLADHVTEAVLVFSRKRIETITQGL